ncbi:MAG: TonB family protein [Deltaproteobacteria bacterium]|nr:TonB family protein [Deltaproteobacteria bacterium]
MSLSLPESDELKGLPGQAPLSPVSEEGGPEVASVPLAILNSKRSTRYIILAVLSVLAHAPLYGGFRFFAGQVPPLSPRDGKPGQVVHLIPYDRKPKPPEVPPDAQFVDTPAQEHVVDAKPVETKLLSDKTTRTEKETRSEVTAPSQPKRGAATQNPVKPAQPSEARSASSQSPDPTTTPKPSDKVELAGGAVLPESPRGKFPKSVMGGPGAAGSGTGILLPSTSASSAIANIQALDTGDLTSTDHLPGMDRGRQTVLNANQYRFSDFFLGVKAKVERHWKPSDVYLRRDPTGQAYGVKDRYTVLRVEIDRSGQITELVTSRASGLDFMDEEAKRAFRAAGPFLNPPAELFEANGRTRFEFGFYFEITGGKYRFNWKRL